MMSWLRTLGLRIVLLFVLVASLLATRVGAGNGPPGLLGRAFAVACDAAERQIAKLESTRTAPAQPDLAALLAHLERDVAATCEAANNQLEVELAIAGSLTPERRRAVLGCIAHHLAEAHRSAECTGDPAVRAEYTATCDQLCALRRLIRWA